MHHAATTWEEPELPRAPRGRGQPESPLTHRLGSSVPHPKGSELQILQPAAENSSAEAKGGNSQVPQCCSQWGSGVRTPCCRQCWAYFCPKGRQKGNQTQDNSRLPKGVLVAVKGRGDRCKDWGGHTKTQLCSHVGHPGALSIPSAAVGRSFPCPAVTQGHLSLAVVLIPQLCIRSVAAGDDHHETGSWRW